MKKIATTAVLLSCLVVLTGCASRHVGETRVNDDMIMYSIQSEQVSKQKVWIKLGQPHRVKYSDSNPNASKWHYYMMTGQTSGLTWIPYVGLLAGGENVQINERIIFFIDDKAVKVEKKYYDVYKNMWAGLAQTDNGDELDEKGLQVKAEMEKLNIPFDEQRAMIIKNIDIYFSAEELAEK